MMCYLCQRLEFYWIIWVLRDRVLGGHGLFFFFFFVLGRWMRTHGEAIFTYLILENLGFFSIASRGIKAGHNNNRWTCSQSAAGHIPMYIHLSTLSSKRMK